MFFTSYEFMGFVIILLLLYYVLPKKCQQPLLLLANCIFYLAAGPKFFVYILTTAFTVYLAARVIGRNLERQKIYLKERKAELGREEKKAFKDGCRRVRLRWLVFCLLINFGILAVLKYANFFLSNVNGILDAFGQRPLALLNLVLPLGISFYTFQSVGYLVDVYRESVPAEKNFFRFALFVSFFPLLIQGPISRYEDLAPTLYGKHDFDAKTVSYGLQRMLWGYFKKMVIADRVLAGVLCIIDDPGTYYGAYALVGALLYTLQLYSDFTGGIDITIGIAQTLGITVQENFRRPYFSKSLKEYWRRWHISLGIWFKNYLFYPISVCKPMQKFGKFCRAHLGERAGKRLPVYVSSFMVWFATGIWHGASWNFIVWGLANFVILMVSEEFEGLYVRFHQRFAFSNGWWYRLFQVLRTFMIICMLHLFDCYVSVRTAFRLFFSMFTAGNWNILWDGSLMKIGLTAVDYCILALGVILLTGVSLVQRRGGIRDRIAAKPYPVRFLIWLGLFLAVLLLGAYSIGYDSNQFIYNRF